MNGDLVLHKAGKYLVQYRQMCESIAVCHRLDECKDIIDKSVALASYYAQIKDIETETMFHRVRVRAWRRIGELFAPVDLAGCETQSAKAKRIRAAFPDDPTVSDMSDSRILEIIELMKLSNDDFEYAIKQNIRGSLADLFRRTPAWEKDREEATRRWRDQQKPAAAKPWTPEEVEAEAEAHRREKAELQAAQREHRLQSDHKEELLAAAETAMKEVGITLQRKDRAKMKQVVFLIKAEVHAVMRQAAFDKKITMQELLRRGLKLWLEANGYDFPDDDQTKPPPSQKQRQEARQ